MNINAKQNFFEISKFHGLDIAYASLDVDIKAITKLDMQSSKKDGRARRRVVLANSKNDMHSTKYRRAMQTRRKTIEAGIRANETGKHNVVKIIRVSGPAVATYSREILGIEPNMVGSAQDGLVVSNGMFLQQIIDKCADQVIIDANRLRTPIVSHVDAMRQCGIACDTSNADKTPRVAAHRNKPSMRHDGAYFMRGCSGGIRILDPTFVKRCKIDKIAKLLICDWTTLPYLIMQNAISVAPFGIFKIECRRGYNDHWIEDRRGKLVVLNTASIIKHSPKSWQDQAEVDRYNESGSRMNNEFLWGLDNVIHVQDTTRGKRSTNRPRTRG